VRGQQLFQRRAGRLLERMGEAKGECDLGRSSYPGPMPAGGGIAPSGNSRLLSTGSRAGVHGRERMSGGGLRSGDRRQSTRDKWSAW
jgi:hypothetical protein